MTRNYIADEDDDDEVVRYNNLPPGLDAETLKQLVISCENEIEK